MPQHVPPASQQQFGSSPQEFGQVGNPQGQYTPPPPPSIGGPGYGGPGGPGMPVGTKVPNYLIFSIIMTICCCPLGSPFGIVSIIFGASVNSKLAAGDYAGAQKASANARLWLIIGLVVALAGMILSFFMGGFEDITRLMNEGAANR
ncbi:MAG TPA: CD225/dispanin family protein [Thermoanaerobaculia bacterium]